MVAPDPGGPWYGSPFRGIVSLVIFLLLLWLLLHFLFGVL